MKSALIKNQSLGLVLITALAVVSGIYWFLNPAQKVEGLTFWRVNDTWDKELYGRAIEDWAEANDQQVNIQVLGENGLWQRMRSGFFSGTPMADLIEMHLEIMMGCIVKKISPHL